MRGIAPRVDYNVQQNQRRKQQSEKANIFKHSTARARARLHTVRHLRTDFVGESTGKCPNAYLLFVRSRFSVLWINE